MFLCYLLYILIFNFNLIKSLQTDTMKSVNQLTTFESTTDYKKKLRKTIQKYALHYFTKKNQLLNAPTRKLKTPNYLIKSKRFYPIIHFPYITHTKNVTVKQNRATTESIPSRISRYPTKVTYIPRTSIYTLQKNSYNEKSQVSNAKKAERKEKSTLTVINKKFEKVKYINAPIVLPKISLSNVRNTKTSNKDTIEKRIEDELKFRRELIDDDVALDLLNDELTSPADLDYIASSYTRRNNSRIYYNHDIFNGPVNETFIANIYYRHQMKNNRSNAELRIQEMLENLTRYERRKPFRTRKSTGFGDIEIEKFDNTAPFDNAMPSETQTGTDVESPKSAEFFYAYITDTNQETDVTDAGVTLAYETIDKDVLPETEPNLRSETKPLFIQTEDSIMTSTSQTVPRTLKDAFAWEPTRTPPVWRLHPRVDPILNELPEMPNVTLMYYIYTSTITPKKTKRKKKKSKHKKKNTHFQQANANQLPVQMATAVDKKNSYSTVLQDILATNYQTPKDHTLNPGVNDILRRLNQRKPITIPPHMQRDWAQWKYRRGKTGDPHIYLDLFNNFYDANYVTR